MEEDIKILETYLKNSAYKEKDSDFFKNGGWEIVDLEIPQAIDNLLKGYRELKEITNTYDAFANDYIPNDVKMVIADRKFFQDGIFNESFIPKSKIKEKIEELEKYRNLAREMIEHRVVVADSDSLNYGRAEAHNKDIEVLQELIEEK